MAQKDEPSMEEILSSIKRIIAEEGDAPPRPTPEIDPEPDVLELDQAVVDPAPTVEADADEPSAEEAPALAQAPSAPAFQKIAPAPAPMPTAHPVVAEALLSSTSAEASRQALASLSKMIVKPEDTAADNTLEGLVRDLLRPMLKQWLDANLPRIVQATVDREVARISGRD